MKRILKKIWKYLMLFFTGRYTIIATVDDVEEIKKEKKRNFHVSSTEYIHIINMLHEQVQDAILYVNDTNMNTGMTYYCLQQITTFKKKLKYLETKIKSLLLKKTTDTE